MRYGHWISGAEDAFWDDKIRLGCTVGLYGLAKCHRSQIVTIISPVTIYVNILPFIYRLVASSIYPEIIMALNDINAINLD